MASPSQAASSASSRFEDFLDEAENTGSSSQIPRGFVIEELSPDTPDSSFDPWQDTPHPVTMATAFIIPSLFTSWPPITDALETSTSQIQNETVEDILPYLDGTSGSFTALNIYGVPHLDRARHIRFLRKCLGRLPAEYVAADAARPWFFYWVLCALGTLGEDVSPYKKRLISTVTPMQNITGGFGGGHGQMSHLAPTYAIVLALSMVGGDDALEVIDRKTMWRWLGALKQPDGGFQMCVGGEEDVRGAYCAAVIISLLDLPLELPSDSLAMIGSREITTLLSGLPEYVARCQTFEGGISNRPELEAHGGYAFCALACLCILDAPHVIIPKYLDLPALISWLSARQYAPEGGFAGRTNKLVDGCYSHWVGACWPLVAAALKSSSYLYSREGLIRYILCACQDTERRGGMRDKPGKVSDAYHTCYVLAGLSSAQHTWTYTTPDTDIIGMLTAPYTWTISTATSSDLGETEEQVFDEVDRVEPLHPVFAVPTGVAERTRLWFEGRSF